MPGGSGKLFGSFWRSIVNRWDREGRRGPQTRRTGGAQTGGEAIYGYYAFKWVWIAAGIGIVAGLGAIVFDLLINVITVVALNDLADTSIPSTAAARPAPLEAAVRSIGHPILLPLVVGVGGFLSGLLVAKLSPESAGGGNESVIASYHYEAGRFRRRVPFVKMAASALTLGTGGSAGREGPAGQISAGFGSLIGAALNLNTSERRRCVLIGMGAGIGAIFRAPLGGAILASEMMYREDIESDALIPALIGSIASYTVFSLYGGFQPLFSEQADVVFDDAAQLTHYAVIGVIAGVFGLLFVRTFHQTERFFQRLPAPLPVKTGVAGLLVGLIGLAVPQTLETGYGWVQQVIDGNFTEISLAVLLLLPLLKIITTSLTVGSGTSGGVFGPGVFIGAMLGATYWRLFEERLPAMPPDPASMTIIAMIAYLGAVSHVPLAAMLMVAEMTRNLSLLAPAMVALGIASLIVGPETLFRSQLPTKSDSPVHRHRYAFPLLSTLIAGEAVQTPALVLRPGQSIEEAETRLHEVALTGAPVVNEEHELIGVLTAKDIAAVPEDGRRATYVIDLMTAPRARFDRQAALDTIFDSMATENLGWIPITETAEGRRERLLGLITLQSVLSAYRLALRRNVRRTDAMMVGSTLLEVRVTHASPLCAVPVRDLELPDDALLVSYTRGEVVRFPHGDTTFEPGDRVGVVTSVAAEQRIRRFFEEEYMVERV